MKNRGKRFTPPAPRREKAVRQGYRRDPEFCGFLAKELEMEVPPESFSKAMRRVYAELPRDMPVRHYPFRSAMKSLATVAVLLVVFGVSLLGANSVYPQLTESLPGVGMLFKAMNGAKPEETPDTPELPVPLVAEGKLAMPEFEPVTLSCQGDILEELTVENAWSDGEKLYLHMSLLALESQLQTLSQPSDMPYGYIPPVLFFLTDAYRDVAAEIFQEYYPGEEFDDKAAGYQWSSISINGQKVESVMETRDPAYLQYAETNSALALHYEETEDRVLAKEGVQAFARYTGNWVLEVPQGARDADVFSVSLNLPQLFYAGVIAPEMREGGEPMAILEDAFQGDFTVEADRSGALELEALQADNKVEITQMSYTPAELTATLNVPFLGYCGYSLLPPARYHGGPVPQKPYGMYAVVSGEDGTVLASQNIWDDSATQRAAYEADRLSGYQRMKLRVNLSPEKRQSLVLTLYYFDPEEVKFAMDSAGIPAGDLVNPVAAEFTLDLAEGTAAPSVNYEKQGLVKPDAEMSPYILHHPELQEGIYVQGVTEDILFADQRVSWISLCVRPDRLPWVQDWALQCYIGDELAQTVYACDVQDDSAYNERSGALEDLAVYNSGSGLFWREESGQSNYEDDDYAHLHFIVEYPEWDLDSYGGVLSSFSRMDLVDAATGEVILADLRGINRTLLEETLCGSLYKELEEGNRSWAGESEGAASDYN